MYSIVHLRNWNPTAYEWVVVRSGGRYWEPVEDDEDEGPDFKAEKEARAFIAKLEKRDVES